MAKRRKPGIVCRVLSIEIRETNNRMRRVCDECGEFPDRLRLDVTHGAGRHAKLRVLCNDCGAAYLVTVSAAAVVATRIMKSQHMTDEDVRI